MIGAKTALSATERIWTTMVGFTTPVPRRAEPIEISVNCSARPGVLAVLAPTGLRDEGHRPDAHDLRHGHDEELKVAGGAQPRDGGIAEPTDEIQVNQVIQGLKHHPAGDGAGQFQDVAGDGALGEVVHGGACLRRT